MNTRLSWNLWWHDWAMTRHSSPRCKSTTWKIARTTWFLHRLLHWYLVIHRKVLVHWYLVIHRNLLVRQKLLIHRNWLVHQNMLVHWKGLVHRRLLKHWWLPVTNMWRPVPTSTGTNRACLTRTQVGPRPTSHIKWLAHIGILWRSRVNNDWSWYLCPIWHPGLLDVWVELVHCAGSSGIFYLQKLFVLFVGPRR